VSVTDSGNLYSSALTISGASFGERFPPQFIETTAFQSVHQDIMTLGDDTRDHIGALSIST
jgi:hypothetical protein